MSNITLNIVEPGSGPVVPDTGLFTSSIGGPGTIVITISAVMLLVLAALIVFTIIHRKKAANTNGINMSQSNLKLNKSFLGIVKDKKTISIALASLVFLIPFSTIAGLIIGTNKSNTNAVEGNTDTLTVTTSDTEFTIELSNEPVFKIFPVEVTVEEATEAGYTLTSYAEDTNLVSTTDSSKVIPMVTVDGEELTTLTNNTYGLSLVEPESRDSEVYTSLSADAENPTTIKTMADYAPTEENDTTTIYYAFYITPDVPYGAYTGSNITYEAIANEVATVTFDSNGLFFDGGKTTNVVKYMPNSDDAKYESIYSHTPNISDEGAQNGFFDYGLNTNEVITIPGAANLSVKLNYGSYGKSFGYVSFWKGAFPNYRANSDSGNEYGVKKCGSAETDDGKFFGNDANSYNTVQCTIGGDSVTFGFWSPGGGPSYLGYGYYAAVTGYDANDHIINITGYGNERLSGDYSIPVIPTNIEFLGWDTDPNAGSPAYVSKDAVTRSLPLGIGDNITLYAIWTPAPFNISYDGNNATTGSMDSTSYEYNEQQEVAVVTTLGYSNVSRGTTIDLYAPNYKRTGYGFVGWSADKNAWTHFIDNDPTNDPKIYGPNQTIAVDGYIVKGINSTTNTSTLYAVWAPAETNITMQTFDPTNSVYTSKSIGSVMALKDERDDEVYAVAKLADGNWWMIENLRLDSSAELSTTNTNIDPNNSSLPLINSYNNDTTPPTPIKSNYLSATSNSWCTNSGDEYCINRSMLNTNNTNLGGQGAVASYNGGNDNSRTFQWYSYGNYYNRYSATAGNSTYSTGSDITAASDLCPAGWHLPYGGSQNGTEEGQNKGNTKGGFYYLNNALNNGSTDAAASDNWRSFPNNFVYSGHWCDSSACVRGYGGYYWSSTTSNSVSAYYLFLNSSYVEPGTYNDVRYYGNSVRCLAQ